MTEYSDRFFFDMYGLTFHTYKVYLIDFINLMGLFSLPVKEGVQGFYFFVSISSLFFSQKTTKTAFKKAIYKKIIKTFCANLFLRLDKILDFTQNIFSHTSLNFAKSAKN